MSFGDKVVDVIIEHSTNPVIRYWHVKTEICDTTIAEVFYRVSSSDPLRFSNVGDGGKRVVEGLLSIPGVRKVVIESYLFAVGKAQYHSWEEIETAVEEVLRWVLDCPLSFYRVADASDATKAPEPLHSVELPRYITSGGQDLSVEEPAWREMQHGFLLPIGVDLNQLAEESRGLDIPARVALLKSLIREATDGR